MITSEIIFKSYFKGYIKFLGWTKIRDYKDKVCVLCKHVFSDTEEWYEGLLEPKGCLPILAISLGYNVIQPTNLSRHAGVCVWGGWGGGVVGRHQGAGTQLGMGGPATKHPSVPAKGPTCLPNLHDTHGRQEAT